MADPLKTEHKSESSSPPPLLPPTVGKEDFRRLFRRHYTSVSRWLVALGISPHENDDVVQETFVVALRYWDKRAPDNKFRSWLFAIARRVAANHRRSQKRAKRRLDVLGWLQSGRKEDQTPEDALSNHEMADFLNAFLHGLDEEMRLVFVMYEIDGASAPEVADTLGISTRRVHSRVRAARARLTKQIVRRKAQEKRGEHG